MTAEQRAGLSDAALAMTQPCIDELIKDISRRVQKAGAITDTAEYQLYRAQALGERPLSRPSRSRSASVRKSSPACLNMWLTRAWALMKTAV